MYGKEFFPFSIMESRANRLIDRLIVRLIQRIKTEIDLDDTIDNRKIKIINAFDALRFRSRFIYSSEKNKAFNYGIAFGLRTLGHKEASIFIHDDACDECRLRNKKVPLDYVTMEDIPGFHSNCSCYLVAG